MQGNILLVDDDRDFAEGLVEFLDLEGYKTNIAFDKSNAIALNRKISAEIAILDTRLGQEDGLSLIEALRADNPNMQYVMLTGQAALNTAAEAVRLGAQDYLMKPVDRDQLRAVLDRCMRMRMLIDAEANARAALETSEDRIRLLTELSPVGVFQTDPQGGYSMVNPRWRELTGMTEADALGPGWQDTLHERDRGGVIEAWDISVCQNRPFSAEFRLDSAKDGIRWVLAQALPRLNDDGELAGYIGTMTDITDHKDLEPRQLGELRAQAFESVAGAIAHHMNNALQIVAGYLQLAHDETAEGSKSREYLELTYSGISRLSAITRNLMNYNGATILHFNEVHANELIANIHKAITDTQSPATIFELNLADNLWTIKSEPTQLQSAFDAIIQNALDAMDGDGTIHITSTNRSHEEPPAEIEPGDYIVITIGDTGPGMSKKTAERALEPLFTTKGPQTMGLGLSMAQGVIRKSGGAMRLDSKPGDGTRVTIWLPRSQES